ncbi:MAG: hypothetical protein ACOX1Q_03655 [Eubacteriales bacterium]
MNNIEAFFEEYIDSEEAEAIFDSLFSAIRKAYIAGYKAGKISRGNKEGQIIKLELIDNTKLLSKAESSKSR